MGQVEKESGDEHRRRVPRSRRVGGTAVKKTDMKEEKVEVVRGKDERILEERINNNAQQQKA